MEINFPVVQINDKQSIYVELTEKNFGKCTSTSLKKGYFENMILVDSTGKKYKVNKVIDVKPLNSAWHWPLELLTYSSRLYKANLDLKLMSQLTINEFKTLIKKSVNTQKIEWESGIGINRVLKDIDSTTSFKTLIQVLQSN